MCQPPATRLHSCWSRGGKACARGDLLLGARWAWLAWLAGPAGLAGWPGWPGLGAPSHQASAKVAARPCSRLDAEAHEKKGVIRCRVVWPRFPFPSRLQQPQYQTDRCCLPFRESSRPAGAGEGPIASASRCTAGTSKVKGGGPQLPCLA